MKITRKQLRSLIMEAAADVEQGVRDYLSRPGRGDQAHYNPYRDPNTGRARGFGTAADYDLTGEEIRDHAFGMDSDMYGEEDVERDQFDSEVQAALDKLVDEGILELTYDGYIMLDPKPLNNKGIS
jgi:hypothetical protein